MRHEPSKVEISYLQRITLFLTNLFGIPPMTKLLIFHICYSNGPVMIVK